MKRILVLFALQIVCLSAFAQTVDRVFAKDGSVYEGYISEQIPGESISVYAEKAEFSFDNSRMSNYTENIRSYSNFTRKAQSWLRESGRDTVYVQTVSFDYDGVCYEDALLEHEDEDSTTILSLNSRTYRIPWDNILRTEKIRQDEGPYGFKDVILLISGERIEGTISRQIPGGELTFVDDSGEERTFSIDDIMSIRSESTAKDHSVWDQAILLDCIETDDGLTDEGFIESRILGRKIILRSKSDDSVKEYDLGKIVKFRKILNTSYAEEYDAPANETMPFIKINGDVVSAQNTVKSEQVLYVVDSGMTEVAVGTEVIVEIMDVECDNRVSLFPMKMRKYKVRDHSDYFGYEYPSYNEADVPLSYIPGRKSMDGMLTFKFTIDSKGFYFLALTAGRGLAIKAE